MAITRNDCAALDRADPLAPLRARFFIPDDLHHNIFQHSLSVQHPDDAVAVARIMLGVRYHYYSSSYLIQISQQLHNFITIG